MTEERLKEFIAWVNACGMRFPGRRVMVLEDKPEQQIGSIIIPDQAQVRPKRGRVVAFGALAKAPSKDGSPSDIEGLELLDTVLFNIYNTLTLSIPDRAGQPVRVSVFHVSDIVAYWPRADFEVEVLK